MTGRAFSLVEILVAMVIVSFALFALLVMNSSSNRGAKDSQFDVLAAQLGQEPLEILSAFGYRWLANPANELPEYPLQKWHSVSDPMRYPQDADQFERYIDLEKVAKGTTKAIKVTVTVRPKDSDQAKKWMTRAQMVFQAIVIEGPK
jgi:prepilin-type N-terminal cleavage/methylation domain-containing protein